MKLISSISFFLIIVFNSSCYQDSCKNQAIQIGHLEKKITEDSLKLLGWGQERVYIDSLLSSVKEIADSIASGNISKSNLSEKTNRALEILEISKERIQHLRVELENSKDRYKNNPLLIANLQDLEADLEYKGLLIQALKDENKTLQKKIVKHKKTIYRRDVEIDALELEIAKAAQELGILNQSIEKARQEKNKLTLEMKNFKQEHQRLLMERNTFYIGLATQLIATAKKLKGGLGGNVQKMKKTMIREAYDILCDAHKNKKIYQALSELQQLEQNREFQKFLKDKSCD